MGMIYLTIFEIRELAFMKRHYKRVAFLKKLQCRNIHYNTFFNKELNVEYKRNSHKSILKSDNQEKWARYLNQYI